MNFLDRRLPTRFWNKVIPEPMSGCWLWIGALTPDGYGQLRWPDGTSASRRRSVHQIVLEVLGIELNETVDHRCEVRCCVNPWHIDPVTNLENQRRRWLRHPTTHCPRGHERTEENLYRSPSSNLCRLCHNEKARARTEELFEVRMRKAQSDAERDGLIRRRAQAQRRWQIRRQKYGVRGHR